MKINNTEFITSAVKKEHYPEHNKKEIVLLGRSNVGKSTFLNCFTNRKKIAYTSSTPGKTQVLNFFNINNDFVIVDVPGYGYARVSKVQRDKFGEMIEEFLTTRDNLSFVVLLVDFKVGPTEDDILMYNFLKFYNIDIIIVATKKDKVKKSLFSKHEQIILKKFFGLNIDHVFIYSKDEKQTLEKVYDFFDYKLDMKD